MGSRGSRSTTGHCSLSLPIKESIAVKTTLLGAMTVLLAAGAAQAAEPTRYVLEPAAVWSAGDVSPHAGWVVAVEGERIVGVGQRGSVPAGPGAVSVPL